MSHILLAPLPIIFLRFYRADGRELPDWLQSITETGLLKYVEFDKHGNAAQGGSYGDFVKLTQQRSASDTKTTVLQDNLTLLAQSISGRLLDS